MRINDIAIFLLPFFAITQVLAQTHLAKPRPIPRDLDAILVEAEPASSIPSPAPTPFLNHLDLRQVAAAAPAAPAVNGAQANAPAAPVAPNAPAAPAPAAAAPVAPVAPAAGVGGAGAAPAAAQPAPGALANPVTTLTVQTVVGGVTKQVPKIYTQSFGAAASAPPVLTGTIGLGTLTGKVGVVKTKDAKSDAVPLLRGGLGMEVLVILGLWSLGMVVGGGLLGVSMAS